MTKDDRLNILLIEDNPADARLINEYLLEGRDLKTTLIHEDNLNNGIKKLSDSIFDLVLLDLGLPDSAGLGAIEKILAVSHSVPVIILTGLEDEQAALKAVKMGAQDYLIKGEIESRLLTRSIRYAIERKRIQEKLRESEDHYRSLFAKNNSIMLLIDSATGEIKDVNSAACIFYGYSRDEFLKLNISALNMLSENDLKDRLFKAYSQTQDQFIFCHRLKNGEIRDVEVHSGPINKGPQKFLYSIIHDVTERRKMEEKVKAALSKEKELNELKSRFVSMISHEYRTPLTAILSSAELLELYGYKWSEEKKKEHLEKIKVSISYMTDMLTDVLLINRAEAGGIEFNPEMIELNAFCSSMVEDLQIINRSKCCMSFESDAEEANAFMDKKILNYIFNNLLINAIKYNNENGIVKFTLSRQSDKAVFRIIDNGFGIAEEDQPRLFEQFYRGNNSENIPGTGLGLSIVKRCVEMHKGKISFTSRPGFGTTFTVELPLLKGMRF